MLIVQACELLFTGDGRYRMHDPMRELGNLTGVTTVDCHVLHPRFPELAEQADILILQFYNQPELLELCERRRKAQKATVFETADYYFDIQPWNPIVEHWLDPDICRLHIEFIRAVDALQTSTPRLARHWEKMARKVVTFENNLTEVPELHNRNEGPLVIGWAGSQGHLADWYATTRILQIWLNERSDVRVKVMSHEMAKDFLLLKNDRYEFVEAGTLDDYLRFLNGIDIGLAPLLNTEYNHCRSDVKYLEYAAHGIIPVVQKLTPYEAVVKDGENGFFFSNDDELIKTLEKLYWDKTLREKVRTAAYHTVKSSRLLSQNIEKRLEFYKSLVPGQQTDSVPENLLYGATREGNYFQLMADNTTHTILEVSSTRPSADNLAKAREVMHKTPHYTFGSWVLGKLLNDLKLPDDAKKHLEEALCKSKHNPRLLAELGRSCLLQGDLNSAYTYLSQSVQESPYFLTGWIYLIHFAKQLDQEHAQQVIDELDKVVPHSYTLAFMTLECVPKELVVKRASDILERFKDLLNDRERSHAAPLFARIFSRVTNAVDSTPELLKLLEDAVQIFPDSTLMLDLCGRCARSQGDHEKSEAYYSKALSNAHSARQYQREFQNDPEAHGRWYQWLIAGYAG